MAFEDYDDYEKSEHVVQWLRENATAIVSGIVLGLLLIFGINQWREHQATHKVEAANQYQLLVEAIQADNQNAIDAAAATLQDKYKDTSFAVFSALRQAELAVAAGKPADAERPLKWARQHASSKAIKGLAQLRLARIELATGKATEALQTLDGMAADTYVGMSEELRGDALDSLKRTAEARTAYQSALDRYEADGAPVQLVQLKLDNLPATGKQDS